MNHLKYYNEYKSISESIKIEKVDYQEYENETVTSLPYKDLVPENRIPFYKKIIYISEDLGISPLWLLHTIFANSRMDHKMTNDISGQIGLLGFNPEILTTFIESDTGKPVTYKYVLQMDNLDQLDVVHAFYKSWKDKLNLNNLKAGDFAAITFYPPMINKKDSYKLPEYLTAPNKNFFSKFNNLEDLDKASYYKKMEIDLNFDGEYETTNKYILGDYTGALFNPYSYNKDSFEDTYIETIGKMNEPTQIEDSINPQDKENTEKEKQSK